MFPVGPQGPPRWAVAFLGCPSYGLNIGYSGQPTLDRARATAGILGSVAQSLGSLVRVEAE
jgi:hypothetical protein